MPYITVKDENKNIFTVQKLYNDVPIDIGQIEQPYRDMKLYFAMGWNHETLGNNGGYIFRNFEQAERRIVDHYENEMEALKRV